MSEEKSSVLIRFREQLGGFFYDFLRAAGISTPMTTANERIRQIGERMAKTIEAAAEAKAIEVIRRLQKVVADSFVKVEEELNKTQDILLIHQSLLEKLHEDNKRLNEEIERLKEKLI